MFSAIRSIVLCRLNKHRPVRKYAKWDGERYVGTCCDCGVAIKRLKRRTWRRAQ